MFHMSSGAIQGEAHYMAIMACGGLCGGITTGIKQSQMLRIRIPT